MAGTTTISNETLKAKVEELAGKVDLETTGFKQFVSLLTKELGGNIDLKQQKPFIKECLLETIQENQGSNPETEENNDDDGGDEDHHYGEDEDDEDEEDAPATKPAKKKGGGGGGGGGLAAQKPISAALAQFFGRGTSSSEAQMARTDIVKRLWEYIREHKLQNPQNRREVMLDAALQKVFGVPQFTIFTMNKYVSAHIYPFKPVDLTTSSNPYKKRKNPSSGAAASSKEGAAEKAAKTARRKAAAAGTQPPWRLSDELQAVVGGVSTLPRPQVVSKIWEYIRAHNLQNPKDKREILCDDKLSRVMGGQTTVTMFTLNRYISPHLLEKLGGGGGSSGGGGGGGGGKGEKQETSQTKKKKTTKKHEAPPVANQQEEDGDFDEE
ncbi:hypothetical protein ACA910_006470 [Epithemia clementina (nom. ined.)]